MNNVFVRTANIEIQEKKLFLIWRPKLITNFFGPSAVALI